MLSFETQQRIREALRRSDQLAAADAATEHEVQKQAQGFRDNFFAALQFIETESMTLQEVQVQIKRIDKQQLQVQLRGRPTLMVVFDPEMAYDHKPQPRAAGQAPESVVELAGRLFVVFAPPYQGVVRYYTIFSDGTWKRTTFTATGSGVQTRSTLVPRSSPDVLAMEVVDLLGYVSTLHPAWSDLTADVETIGLEAVRDRTRVKIHLTGLGAPRRGA